MAHRRPEYGGPERRVEWENGNGNGLLSQVPSWTRILIALGATGVLSMIAVYLVYTNNRSMPEIQKSMIVIEQQHMDLNKAMLEQIEANSKTLRLMQKICQHTAKTEGEKDQCLNP